MKSYDLETVLTLTAVVAEVNVLTHQAAVPLSKQLHLTAITLHLDVQSVTEPSHKHVHGLWGKESMSECTEGLWLR